LPFGFAAAAVLAWFGHMMHHQAKHDLDATGSSASSLFLIIIIRGRMSKRFDSLCSLSHKKDSWSLRERQRSWHTNIVAAYISPGTGTYN